MQVERSQIQASIHRLSVFMRFLGCGNSSFYTFLSSDIIYCPIFLSSPYDFMAYSLQQAGCKLQAATAPWYPKPCKQATLRWSSQPLVQGSCMLYLVLTCSTGETHMIKMCTQCPALGAGACVQKCAARAESIAPEQQHSGDCLTVGCSQGLEQQLQSCRAGQY